MTVRLFSRHSLLTVGGLSTLIIGAAVAAVGTADAATHQATGTIRMAGSPDAVRGSYIVVLKDAEVRTAAVDSMAKTLTARHGGAVKQSWDAALLGFELSASEQTARRYAADPRVAYVQATTIVRASGTQTNPPSFGLDRVDQRRPPLDNKYTFPNTAANVQAFIIDTGIQFDHTDLGGRATFGFDAVGDGRQGKDCNGHGTHVAGTVGGATFGLAKQAKLVAVRVLGCDGSGTSAGVIKGIDWVTKNARKPAVANMSLGGPEDPALDAAVQRSIRSGVTYALAAGNENRDACATSPARVDTAITVGATDQRDARASFSNFGRCLDILAPGVNIRSAFAGNGTNGSAVLSGTSMAAPHVAGAAALILAQQPTFSPQQVRDALVNNATPNVVTDLKGSPNKLLFVAN